MNAQNPLGGAGDRFCKLTFPPSRASFAGVSYVISTKKPIGGSPRTRILFNIESASRSLWAGRNGWTLHQRRPRDARCTSQCLLFGNRARFWEIYAYLLQRRKSRIPLKIVAYTGGACARRRESKLTQSVPSPSQRNLTVHLSERTRLRKS